MSNVTITNVQTNVNEGLRGCYRIRFIYDPSEEATQERKTPPFQFKINDGEMQGNGYQVVVFMRTTPEMTWPTNQYDQYGGPYIAGVANQPGAWQTEWNGHLGNGQGALVEEPCTYTFDIGVWEAANPYDWSGSQTADDNQWMKYNYWLWIPETYTAADGSTKPGHDLKFVYDEASDQLKAKVSYYFEDYFHTDPSSMAVYLLDGTFNVKTVYENEQAQDRTALENVDIYGLSNDDEGGTWRGVFTGVDGHRELRRCHNLRRMVAVNEAAKVGTAYTVGWDLPWPPGNTAEEGARIARDRLIEAGYQTRYDHDPNKGLNIINQMKNRNVIFYFGHQQYQEGGALIWPAPPRLGRPRYGHIFALNDGSGRQAVEAFECFLRGPANAPDDKLRGLPPGSFENSVLVVYEGCHTADTHSIVGNLLEVTTKPTAQDGLAAMCALGWTTEIYGGFLPYVLEGATLQKDPAHIWAKAFWEAWCSGTTGEGTPWDPITPLTALEAHDIAIQAVMAGCYKKYNSNPGQNPSTPCPWGNMDEVWWEGDLNVSRNTEGME